MIDYTNYTTDELYHIFSEEAVEEDIELQEQRKVQEESAWEEELLNNKN